MMNRKSVKIIISILLTIVVLFFFFRSTSLQEIGRGFAALSFLPILIFVILSLFGTILRTFKYNILIANKLSFKDMFLITLVRNFAVDLLPARTASLVLYTYLIRKRGIRVEEGSSSFIISMFYDVLSLAIMLSIAFAFIGTELNSRMVYAGLLFLFLMSIAVIMFSRGIISSLLQLRILKKSKKIVKILTNISEYLQEHTSIAERLKLLGLSFAIRVTKYVSVFILFIYIIDIAFGLKPLSLFSFGIAGTELSSVLPVQGISGFGTWEMAFKIVFESLKFQIKDPFLVGLVIHVVTQLWEYLIGLAALIYMMLKRERPLE
jgi:hypothetical protein